MTLPDRTLEAVTNGHQHMQFSEDGHMTSASGSGLDLYILHSLVAWIKFELETGMRMTAKGSTLKKANEMLGTKYKRKEQALAHLESLLSVLKTEEK